MGRKRKTDVETPDQDAAAVATLEPPPLAPVIETALAPERVLSAARLWRDVPIPSIGHHPRLPNHRAEELHDEAKLQALADSIQREGRLLQPIMVTEAGSGWAGGKGQSNPEYLVVYGHRRLEACRRLGWRSIPAEVRPPMTDAQILLERAVENLHRQELNPMEEVRAVEQAVEAVGDVQEAARKLGQTLAWTRDRLMLGGKLAPATRRQALAGLLGIGHLRELAKISDHDEQGALADELTVDFEGTATRPTVEEVARSVQRSMQDLRKVGWALHLPFAGERPCDGCPSSTASDPELFGDGELRCTNATCYNHKRRTFEELARDVQQRLVKAKVFDPTKEQVAGHVAKVLAVAKGEPRGDVEAVNVGAISRTVKRGLKYHIPREELRGDGELAKAIKAYHQSLDVFKEQAASALAGACDRRPAFKLCLLGLNHRPEFRGATADDIGSVWGGDPRPPQPIEPLPTEVAKLVVAAAEENVSEVAAGLSFADLDSYSENIFDHLEAVELLLDTLVKRRIIKPITPLLTWGDFDPARVQPAPQPDAKPAKKTRTRKAAAAAAAE
jgi:ParB family chromosome partitioning protein